MSVSALGTVEGMSRERGEQPTRRTVAELLEQNGAQPASGSRRHRRRAQENGEDELTTTAPQAIIDRINSETTDVDSPPRRNGSAHSHAAPDAQPAPPPPPAAQPPAPQPPPPVRPAPQQPPQPPGSGYNRAMPPPSTPSWPAPPQQPGVNGYGAPPGRPPVGESTDQMAAVGPGQNAYGYVDEYADEYADYQDEYEYADGYHQGYPSGYQAAPYGYAKDYEDEYDPAYHPGYESDYGAPIPGEPATSLMAPVGSDMAAEEAEYDEQPAGKEWLAVAAQLTFGVVGGAGVWLLFNWLWMHIPALALGAALAVVVGLVWIVRKIRKAEDMQTTVLAVLVGVVVTVSPAALLLLGQ